MLDISFIRDNLDLCKQAAVHKNRVVDWDRLLTVDEERKKAIQAVDEINRQKNQLQKKRDEGLTVDQIREEGKRLKEVGAKAEEELRNLDQAFQSLMLTVPNIPDPEVPVGKDESGNVEIKKVGTPSTFSFPVKDHVELVGLHNLVDFERGAKVAGFRGYFLKNEAALLEFAILFYTFQQLVAKGYTPIMAPSLAKAFAFEGVAQFPWGKEEVYALEKDDLYVSGTAEVPVTAYFSGELLKEEDLPKKFVAFSPCFRREAGSYGKDTKGLYRVHQFNKIEQVIISTNDLAESKKMHEELLANSESILQALELPYRVLLMCTGDMGEPQVKKYDLETWMPGRNAYGETMSNSIMGDFQARRLNIRYRAKDGTVKFAHTLNNTAIASPRILIPILENYQQEDGSIRVPKVLQPFVGKEIIGG
jgi:seryl-tRNA synthetase